MSRSSVVSRLSFAASETSTWFTRRFAPTVRSIAERPFLAAIREALPWGFGALIVAALAVFPFFRGGSLGERIAHAYLTAFGAMAGAFVVALALFYARRARLAWGTVVPASLIGFAVMLPRPFGPDVQSYLRALGPSGLFLALLAVGAVAAIIALARSFLGARAVRVASVCAVVGFLLLASAHVAPSAFVLAVLAPLARLGDTYAALVVIVLVETLLWIVGIHGPAMLAGVVTPVYFTLQVQNTTAFSQHHALPNIVVVSLFLFVFPGGAGATLPLAVLFACSRIKRLRAIGRMTLLPGLFNTNEPLLFGAPVVFNPYLAPPFIIAPLLLATITYASVALGWVARPAYYAPSAIPAPISAYLATLDPRAILLVVVNMAIAALVFAPFVRAYERHVETMA